MDQHTPSSITEEFSFDFLDKIDFKNVDWEKEAKYVGALSGSVIGSFVSSQLSWSLGWRLVTVVGGSYSGALLAALGYQVLKKLAEVQEEGGENAG
jgi:outer membrane lipoprotein SlyB